MYTQKNLEELFEVIGAIPNQKLIATPSYKAIITDNNAWPNQLYNLNCSPGQLTDVIAEIQSNQAIPNLLVCNPATDNKLNIDFLNNKFQRSTWTAMSHRLNDLPSSKNGDLKVYEIHTQSDLKVWLHIVEEQLMSGSKLNVELFESLLPSDSCSFLLGALHDIPVSTALLFKGTENAGVYLVATTSKYRKQGIGFDTTLACLTKAKELNCWSIDLQATSAGYSVYKSLGFKEYGAIQVYRL